jgi:hypothetical protein
LGFHRGENGLAAVERAFEMDVDHSIPFLRANLGKTDEVANSGVVDQDVDTTIVPKELTEGILDLGRVSHVKSDRAGISTSSPNGLRGLSCWLERTVIDDHLSPPVGENIRDGAPQSAPCACDHSDLA